MTKKKTFKDPYASREAKKYEDPVPSREYILEFLKKRGRPISYRALAAELNLTDTQKESIRRRLKAMERDGQLVRTRRGQYSLIKDMGLVRGRFIGHRDGFGFVVPEEEGDDIFLNHREAHGVFHDDEVLVRVTGMDPKGRREAVVVEILQRNTHEVIGRYFEEHEIGVIEPAGKRIKKDILVPKTDAMNAESGQFVVAKILQQPTKHSQAIGQVVEILGEHMAAGMEIDVAIRSYQMPNHWNEAVLAELDKIPDHVTEADVKGRKDIRHLPLVTIDGEDAKDFDDAVYCAKTDSGYRLLVAIADVSHYVKSGSALEKEAYSRGNSVYFPGRVIPMLPEKLSNGLCSLNPKVDRLCMVADMSIDEVGKVKRSQFYPAVMHSQARLTYTKVGEALEKIDQFNEENPPLAKTMSAEAGVSLLHLHELYQVLRKARTKRGAIDLDTTETMILFGENKKIDKIVPVVRNDAHKLIEECMLLANVATANYLTRHKCVNLFRNHEPPSQAKLEKFRSYLVDMGLRIKVSESPTSKEYAAILEKAKSRPDFHILQIIVLRTMSQARYHPENLGHFGLAFKAYAHFTSPIRRYPDLLVHRAIKQTLLKETPETAFEAMVEIGEHCSMTERRADEATRDATDWLKCEYMLDKVGEEFDGVISSVTSFGLFIELKSIYVEGLAHVANLSGDYFCFEPTRHMLIGEKSGVRYQMGDPVRIRVAHVDLDERKIDFELLEKLKKSKKK